MVGFWVSFFFLAVLCLRFFFGYAGVVLFLFGQIYQSFTVIFGKAFLHRLF